MPCHELCCSEFGDEIITSLYTKGLSCYKIADLCRCSHQHIWVRLRSIGVKVRDIRDYPSKGKTYKTSRLWKLSDHELFDTPVDVLMERYVMTRTAVKEHKRKRRKLESAKTITKSADEKGN